jgi:hypothetical protein
VPKVCPRLSITLCILILYWYKITKKKVKRWGPKYYILPGPNSALMLASLHEIHVHPSFSNRTPTSDGKPLHPVLSQCRSQVVVLHSMEQCLFREKDSRSPRQEIPCISSNPNSFCRRQMPFTVHIMSHLNLVHIRTPWIHFHIIPKVVSCV